MKFPSELKKPSTRSVESFSNGSPWPMVWIELKSLTPRQYGLNPEYVHAMWAGKIDSQQWAREWPGSSYKSCRWIWSVEWQVNGLSVDNALRKDILWQHVLAKPLGIWLIATTTISNTKDAGPPRRAGLPSLVSIIVNYCAGMVIYSFSFCFVYKDRSMCSIAFFIRSVLTFPVVKRHLT